jgi:hypothetical protein
MMKYLGNQPAVVSAIGGEQNKSFYPNEATVTEDYTVASGYNAVSAGPVTVANGKTVTIASGSVWTVV